MDAVLRGAAIYLFLLILFRVAGRRTVAEMTSFDFVLLLIISEATQQGLLGEDFSVTNACLVIVTLVGIDVGLSLLKMRWRGLELWMDGSPTVIVADGKPLTERMRKSRVDEEDVLHAARELQGLERLEQIKYAVLERSGGITVIPKRSH